MISRLIEKVATARLTSWRGSASATRVSLFNVRWFNKQQINVHGIGSTNRFPGECLYHDAVLLQTHKTLD